jgi:hypothetical protein
MSEVKPWHRWLARRDLPSYYIGLIGGFLLGITCPFFRC